MYIGNSIVRYDRFIKDFLNCDFTLEGDWKRFDSSLSPTFILLALSIVRCFYKDDDYIDNHFLAIADSLIAKDYVLTGGRVFRIFTGISSESKLTSLLGSIINLLMLLKSFFFLKHENLSFATGGDDFCVFVRNCRMDYGDIINTAQDVADRNGWIFKFLDLKTAKGDTISEYPTFYKYTLYKGIPVVPIENAVERLFSPWNKNYHTPREIKTFALDYLGSLGPPNTGYLLCYEYIRQLFSRLSKREYELEEIIDYQYKFVYRYFSLVLWYHQLWQRARWRHWTPRIQLKMLSHRKVVKLRLMRH